MALPPPPGKGLILHSGGICSLQSAFYTDRLNIAFKVLACKSSEKAFWRLRAQNSAFLIKYQYAIYYGKYLNIFLSLFVESYHNIV